MPGFLFAISVACISEWCDCSVAPDPFAWWYVILSSDNHVNVWNDAQESRIWWKHDKNLCKICISCLCFSLWTYMHEHARQRRKAKDNFKHSCFLTNVAIFGRTFHSEFRKHAWLKNDYVCFENLKIVMKA